MMRWDIIYILPLPLVPLYIVLYTRIELGIFRFFYLSSSSRDERGRMGVVGIWVEDYKNRMWTRRQPAVTAPISSLWKNKNKDMK